jgi:hypothetical protein
VCVFMAFTVRLRCGRRFGDLEGTPNKPEVNSS